MNSTKEQGSRKTADIISPNLALQFTKIYRCGFTGNGYNAAMKKALAHLPEYIKKLHEVTERICKGKIESFGWPQRAQRKYYGMD